MDDGTRGEWVAIGGRKFPVPATLTLTEFLLARIDEDEAEARDELPLPFADSDFGVKWRPHRVMAECQAKRRIVEREIVRACDNVPRSGFVSLEVADAIRGRADTATLRDLAAVYSDHPDYRQDWS